MERTPHRQPWGAAIARRAIRLVRHREPILAAIPADDDAHRDQPHRCERCFTLALAAMAQRPAPRERWSADHRLHLVQPYRPNRLGSCDRAASRGRPPSRPVRPQSRSATSRPVLQAFDRRLPRPARLSRMQGAEGADGLMPGILSAHGFDPGPTQRPLLAGALSGIVATLPAVATLLLFGSLKVEASI